MKRMLEFLSYLLLGMLIVSGCNTKTGEEDIFIYKDSYVGDNSAVINIVNRLMGSENFKGLELKTEEEPYGMVLHYDWIDSEQKRKKTVINNATYLFALIQNADWITFNFDDQEYKITKENLQNAYGEDFRNLQNEEELKTVIRKHMDDEDQVDQLFH